MALPTVFTRVSSSFQWILSTVPALSRHPNQFTFELNITQLGIPGNTYRFRDRDRDRERDREIPYRKTFLSSPTWVLMLVNVISF
jgi:hypothetical protein